MLSLSACLASIGRAIFVWTVDTAVDFSYEICRVGLWTQAEIAIGLVVACLPVSPRFFQVFGPKIRRLVPFLSQPSGVDELPYNHTFSRSDMKGSTKSKRPVTQQSISEKLDDSYSILGQPIEEPSTLSRADHQVLGKRVAGELDSRTGSVRKDLEAGHMSIRVEQTIEVQTTPKDTPMTSLELTRVRRDRNWLLV